MLYILAGILGLGLLVVVHEAGHLLAARASGMHVLRFSIGFGPALISYKSKRTGTLYQIAAIPLLAYVQIAGMNPFEEVDPDDKTSYANASLPARIFAILAGPLANYVFASVLFFLSFSIAGIDKPEVSARVEVFKEGAAATAQLQSGDTVVAVAGTPVRNWDSMRREVIKYPNKPTVFDIDRNGRRLQLTVTPAKNEKNEGKIGVGIYYWKVSMREAAIKSLETPYLVVKGSLIGLARIIQLVDKPDLGGPVRMAQETARAAEMGLNELVRLLGALSAYLGVFNALPFPALDGGRLAFLTYEAVTRRKPNARIEVMVHTLGFAMLLSLILVVTFSDIKRLVIGDPAPASSAAAAPSGAPAPPKK